MDYQDANTVIKNLAKFLNNYLETNKLESVVIGISGGIDSAVTAAIATEAANLNDYPITIYGQSISIESNTISEKSRAYNIGKEFCDEFEEIDLTFLYNDVITNMSKRDSSILSNNKPAKIRRGNIKARMRMISLYDYAQSVKGLVLSTDNYTEYLLGFWTLHGDVGDIGLIQELWKTEVYDLAEYIVNNNSYSDEARNAMKTVIDAVPTDGLGVDDGDLSQIFGDNLKNIAHREGYAIVDTILRNYIANGNAFLCPQVIERYLSSEYKRTNPLNINRRTALNGLSIK